MEENYLISLIVVFFFGLSFLRKDTALSFDMEESKAKNNTSEITGVASYLKNKQEVLQESLPSGVARYIVNKEATSTVSSVSKYLARQSGLADKVAEENKSSVEKYLSSRR